MAFLLVRPSLTQCMNCRVCFQLWCIYGAKFVSMSLTSSVYTLFFYHFMRSKVQMPYVSLIGS